MTVPPPTVPKPRSPTFTGSMHAPLFADLFADACVNVIESSAPGARLAAEHLFDTPNRLAGAMLVLDQPETHVPVAVLAEADAGRDRDPRLLQELLGKFERAECAIGLGNRRPGKHGRLRRLDRPTRGVQSATQNVAPTLVGVADLAHAILRSLQRGDGRHLDRGEGAVVEIGFDACERGDQGPVAAHEADAPARHVVALGHGEEFDGDVLRARDLEDRGGTIAVENDVGIGDVVDHPDPVLGGDIDDLLEEVQLDALRRRIPRKVQDQHLGLRPGVLDGALELLEEVHIRRQSHMTHVGTGDDEPVGMDRVSRVRHQHRIPCPHGRERQMGKPFLGADRDDRFAVRIQMDIEAIAVPVTDGATQPGDAARDRIAMRVLADRRLDQLVDDMLRCRLVGVTHAEVDDVLAPCSRFGLQLVDDVEDIGRQPLDAVKIGLGGDHWTTS
ncbi:hypothetical protein THIOKS1550019 [Thiocapsa sp. KS1]|nr:hypothetical protein THIOKS1550019 [Thiocapsa sp. KS1]